MKIAFIGQPNAGKSTIFNGLAGYKTVTANFPGQTVNYTVSTVKLGDEVFEIVDLPGIYSLTAIDMAELESRKYILSGQADVVINVIDASTLSRSLELTLQLAELQVPMVICLNMMDEARRKGIEINKEKLSQIFGVPVIETVANKGIGLDKIFSSAKEAYYKKLIPKIQLFHKDIEEKIEEIEKMMPTELVKNIPGRYISLKLLEGDQEIFKEIRNYPEFFNKIKQIREEIKKTHGRHTDSVISSERHALTMNIFEEVAKVGEPSKSLREKVDDILTNKYFGYPLLLIIVFGIFFIVFEIGRIVEDPLVGIFDSMIEKLPGFLENDSLIFFIFKGLLEGFSGGLGVAIPYLIPFFIGLTILEDIGYLPRMAFLMDTIMHRIGLHGKSILPFVISYGCNVPGVMGTRILESPRDRFITAALSVFIPCAARSTIIFGLVGAYIGGLAAAGLYIFNICIVMILGGILTKFIPEITPGLIMEIPPLRIPTLKNIFLKTWLRLKDFMLVAWPLLVISSIILSLLEYFKMDTILNKIFSPIVSWMLGLPEETGITLVFGILRKELSMIMLFQAMHTTQLNTVMTNVQLIVFTIFTLFYIPCVGTMGVLLRELGARKMILITVLTITVALILSVLSRIILSLII
ncbi:MAG TPA: ferrous iron transport protein B [Thermodesulfovibrio thiophilus]|uniref:ferrous iron transport protein B n=1 Tax=Thermodesulfovibrio thiophilus TaxID=340095 RepID=UPI0017B42DE3|nr:ferrous iron transport protein B [Thermodesulfovibrio thiophilus]HHW19527.1 ferrous iron transport protein B [Thermodesulfovibrio thiophilus]HOA82336.1 ferrous iron transport protein B [Thermodesulfovibrio thiophilus]HQD35861.1 ferrous iron transport protein B [Thermodesulfovibrio thiophilus]